MIYYDCEHLSACFGIRFEGCCVVFVVSMGETMSVALAYEDACAVRDQLITWCAQAKVPEVAK